MNTNDHDLEAMGKRLSGLALGDPGPEARARILNAARTAWRNASAGACVARRKSIWRDDLFRAAAALAASMLIAAGVQWLDSRMTSAVANVGLRNLVAEPAATPSPHEMAEWLEMNGELTAHLKVVRALSRLPAPARTTRDFESRNRQDMEESL